jgi:hypothetical protein
VKVSSMPSDFCSIFTKPSLLLSNTTILIGRSSWIVGVGDRCLQPICNRHDFVECPLQPDPA